MMRKVTMVFLVGWLHCLILSSPIASYAASDEDIIPPEVTKQMDPEIRSGKRPTRFVVRQEDIFRLKERDDIKADLVSLDIDIGALSTSQKETLLRWLKTGNKTIFLMDHQIEKYAPLLGLAASHTEGFGYQWDSVRHQTEPSPGEFRKYKTKNLTQHEVNTDCSEVYFGTNTNTTYDSGYNWHQGSWSQQRYFYGYFYFSPGPLPDVVVIVEGKTGEAVCGAFNFGNSRVIFQNSVEGPDARRWYLNFMHWVLGETVPGTGKSWVASLRSILETKSFNDNLGVSNEGENRLSPLLFGLIIGATGIITVIVLLVWKKKSWERPSQRSANMLEGCGEMSSQSEVHMKERKGLTETLSGTPIEERLAKLKELHENGLITREDYDERRRKLLEEV